MPGLGLIRTRCTRVCLAFPIDQEISGESGTMIKGGCDD